jgi:hypothetical protein
MVKGSKMNLISLVNIIDLDFGKESNFRSKEDFIMSYVGWLMFDDTFFTEKNLG